MGTLETLDQVEAWLDILDRATYYELLGILEIADESAIQRAFHEFSANFHPDRHRGEPPELIAAITKIYQRGAEAYGVLRSPQARARYDLALRQGALRLTTGTTREAATSAANLAALALTKAGQLHTRQLERALAEGAVDEARECLRKALLSEGSNPTLQQRAEQLLELVRSGRILPA